MATKKKTAPPTTRRTRADGRETAERILDHAEKELTNAGLVNFNLDRVILESGVSRSSVYHHFGGREGVIAAVETRWLVNSLGDGYRDMDEMFSRITSGEEAFRLIEIGVTIAGSAAQREMRERRISTLAMSRTSPATRKILVDTQVKGTRDFADMIRRGRDNGLFDPVEPIDGIAHLIQSMLLGRILVDIVQDPGADDAWTKATIETLRLLLRPSN